MDQLLGGVDELVDVAEWLDSRLTFCSTPRYI